MTIQVDLRSVAEFFAKRGCIPSASPDPLWTGLREILLKSDVYFSKLKLHSLVLALPVDGASESLKRGLLHKLHQAEKELLRQRKGGSKNDKAGREKEEKKRSLQREGREAEVRSASVPRKPEPREKEGGQERCLDTQKSRDEESEGGGLQGCVDFPRPRGTNRDQARGQGGGGVVDEEGRRGGARLSSQDADEAADRFRPRSGRLGERGKEGDQEEEEAGEDAKMLNERAIQHEKGRKEIERVRHVILAVREEEKRTE